MLFAHDKPLSGMARLVLDVSFTMHSTKTILIVENNVD